MNKPDEIVINNGVVFILRDIQALPGYKNQQIIAALRVEDIKEIIKQMDEVEP